MPIVKCSASKATPAKGINYIMDPEKVIAKAAFDPKYPITRDEFTKTLNEEQEDSPLLDPVSEEHAPLTAEAEKGN